MRHFRFYLLLLLTLALKSCEVPDVQPFTKATTDMGVAVDGSLRRVAADLGRVKLPTSQQQLALDSLQARLSRKSRKFSEVAHAFDEYAQALDATSAAGQQRGAAIDKAFAATQKIIATSTGFLKTALVAAGAVADPINAAAKPILAALGTLAMDLNNAKTVHSLSKLASVRQDSAIQLSAQALRLGMRHFYVVDSLAYLLLEANLPSAYTSVQDWYKFTLARQESVTTLLAVLTQAEGYVRNGNDGALANENPKTPDGPIDRINLLDNDPQRLVMAAYASWKDHKPDAKKRTALIDALRQRELFYRPLAELPQAQLDAARARYSGPQRDAELLVKCSQLIDTWAISHHELRLLLAKASHVTRQDVVAYAKTVQTLANELKAAKN